VPEPLLAVVTGPPGAGKTTLAEGLAAELRLPLVAKDAIKEALFDALGIGDREWSRRLGGASLDLLFLVAERSLAAGSSLILEANFSRSHHTRRFGDLPPHRLVQIHVSAPTSLLLERAERRLRHPGHLQETLRAELEERLATDEHEPLQLRGELISVEATNPVDAAAVAAEVERRGRAARGRAARTSEAGSASGATCRR
jgi:predicted kinase